MSQLTLALGFGLVTSAILLPSAVGFTLQFGVSNIFNLAYGDVMTVAAFTAYLVNVGAGADLWVAMAAGAAAGAVILQNAIQAIAGAGFRSYTRTQERPLHLLGMILTARQLVIIGIAVASMLAL